MGVASKRKEGGKQEAWSVTVGPQVLTVDLMEAAEVKWYPTGNLGTELCVDGLGARWWARGWAKGSEGVCD